jgi:hypothetical protein
MFSQNLYFTYQRVIKLIFSSLHYLCIQGITALNTVVCLLKARIVKPQETAVARERLYKHARC